MPNAASAATLTPTRVEASGGSQVLVSSLPEAVSPLALPLSQGLTTHQVRSTPSSSSARPTTRSGRCGAVRSRAGSSGDGSSGDGPSGAGPSVTGSSAERYASSNSSRSPLRTVSSVTATPSTASTSRSRVAIAAALPKSKSWKPKPNISRAGVDPPSPEMPTTNGAVNACRAAASAPATATAAPAAIATQGRRYGSRRRSAARYIVTPSAVTRPNVPHQYAARVTPAAFSVPSRSKNIPAAAAVGAKAASGSASAPRVIHRATLPARCAASAMAGASRSSTNSGSAARDRANPRSPASPRSNTCS